MKDSTADKYCMHCSVSGRVQGVFFRASAQQRAQELGLTGYARNLIDGRVEIYACGDQPSLNAFQDWLWQGPEYANVTSVQCEVQPYAVQQGFLIR